MRIVLFIVKYKLIELFIRFKNWIFFCWNMAYHLAAPQKHTKADMYMN